MKECEIRDKNVAELNKNRIIFIDMIRRKPGHSHGLFFCKTFKMLEMILLTVCQTSDAGRDDLWWLRVVNTFL